MNEKIVNEEQNTKVFTQTKDLPISTIKEMFDDGDIIPQPTYQRDYVMDNKQASKLIESILIQIPIPTVYLCEENRYYLAKNKFLELPGKAMVYWIYQAYLDWLATQKGAE